MSLALNPVPVEEQPVASYVPQVLFGSSAGCFSHLNLGGSAVRNAGGKDSHGMP